MPAFPTQSSNLPATQANCTPITYSSQTPRKAPPASDASISTTVLQLIEQVEALPAFGALPANCPLRARLAPLFASTRQLATASFADLYFIYAKLGKIESIITEIDKKLQPLIKIIYI